MTLRYMTWPVQQSIHRLQSEEEPVNIGEGVFQYWWSWAEKAPPGETHRSDWLLRFYEGTTFLCRVARSQGSLNPSPSKAIRLSKLFLKLAVKQVLSILEFLTAQPPRRHRNSQRRAATRQPADAQTGRLRKQHPTAKLKIRPQPGRNPANPRIPRILVQTSATLQSMLSSCCQQKSELTDIPRR